MHGTNKGISLLAGSVLLLSSFGIVRDAMASTVGDGFYKGQQVTILIGFGVGGGYDLFGRLVARHIGRHIPGNPTVIAQNMTGGGGVVVANYLYNAAKQNGTALGVISQTAALAQRLSYPGVKYDATRFHWIGRMAKGIEVVAVWHASGVKTVEDATKKQVIMGATGAAGTSAMYPRLLNNILKTKFKVVTGYKGMSSTWIAMERGEVAGGSNSLDALRSRKADWLREGKINILVQVALERDPQLPNAPLLFELAKNDLDRQVLRLFSTPPEIGRALTAPPGVPADRVAVLRTAFDRTMTDPNFLADAKRLHAGIEPLSGKKLQEIVSSSVVVSDQVARRAKDAVKP